LPAWLLRDLLTPPPGAAGANAPPHQFWTAFERHLKDGTLLDYQTAREFGAQGWAPFYPNAVATKFEGKPHRGLHLEISTRQGYAPKLSVEIPLEFQLHNRSEEEVVVTTSGSCGVVHQAAFIVIDPRGGLSRNLGRIRAGGFHLCQQNVERLNANEGVKLKTCTDSTSVIGFVPRMPGRHIVIGKYDMTDKQEQPYILSAPLTLDIRDQ
jgi:hypothetical protein